MGEEVVGDDGRVFLYRLMLVGMHGMPCGRHVHLVCAGSAGRTVVGR
jgi:hypothetical protein